MSFKPKNPMKYSLELLFFTTLYFTISIISAKLGATHQLLSPILPVTGFATGLLLKFGRSYWPTIAIGAFFSTFLVGLPSFSVVGIVIGYSLGAGVGCVLIKKILAKEKQMENQVDTIAFLSGATSAALISSSFGSISLWITGIIESNNYLGVFIAWFVGELVSGLVVTPLFNTTYKFSFSHWKISDKQIFKNLLFGICYILCIYLIFFREGGSGYLFLVFPVLLLSVVWFSYFYVRIVSLLTVCISIICTIQFRGAFVRGSIVENLIQIQFFLIVASITTLVLWGFKKSKSLRVSALTLLLCWGITGHIFYFYNKSEIIEDSLRLDEMVYDISREIRHKMDSYISLLVGAAGLYNSDGPFDQSVWNANVDRIQIAKRYPALEGLGIVFKSPNKVRKKNNDERLSVIFRKKSPIFDSKFKYPNAALWNLEKGRAAKSDFVSMEYDDGNYGYNFLFYPIYKTSANFSSNKNSKADLIGWLFGPLSAEIFFSGLENQRNLDFAIYDQSVSQNGKMVYTNIKTDISKLSFQRKTNIQIAQKNLTAYWNYSSGFLSGRSNKAIWVGFFGSMGSLVFALLIVALKSADRKAKKIAEDSTFLILQNERQLYEQKEQFELAMKGTAYGIWDWRVKQKELYVSNKWIEMLGLENRGNIIKISSWLEWIHPEDKIQIIKLVREFFRSQEESFTLEYRIKHQDGTYRWILSKATAIRSDDGYPVRIAGTIKDITYGKLNEEGLRRVTEEALAAEKKKSEFLASMSHEIRTPLNGILCATRFLDESNINSELSENLGVIRKSGEYLLSTLNDVLDFSKIESGRMVLEETDFNLYLMAESLQKAMAFSAREKGIKLDVEIESGVPEIVLGDPSRLRQVLMNLISNAIKFTNGGHVTIRIVHRRLSERFFQLYFEVEDSGIGIPSSEVKNIFNAFTQADSSTTRIFGGSGLGLSICKKLVELMGGKIGVRSEIGKGSVFWFYTQHREIDSPNQIYENVIQIKKTKSERKIKILVAEDNPINQVVMSRMLSKMGYFPHVVSNGMEAVATFNNSDFDLILMDCQMPEMDGYQATNLIRNTKSGIRVPIIAVTANDHRADLDNCIACGMNDIIVKPVDDFELFNKVEKWINLDEKNEYESIA